MRVGFWSSLGSLLAGAAVSLAQPLGTLSIPEPTAVAVLAQADQPAAQPDKSVPETTPPPPTDASPVLAGSDYGPIGNNPDRRMWVSGEYLLWWIKSGPLPVPLVTSGNPADARPGALGSPGTQVLLGGSEMDYGSFSGGRITLGGWLDAEGTFGIEASGFLLESKSATFSTNSSFQGNPTLAIPFRDSAGNERGLLVSFPADSIIPGFPIPRVGGVAFSSSSQLWGAELNGLLNLVRQTNYRFDLIAGVRYVDLHEDLRFSAISETTGEVFDPNADKLSVTATDYFKTRSQFYGGQVGGRFAYRIGALSLSLAGKIALGATHQVIDISGVQTAAIGTDFDQVAPPVVDGGIFAQAANSGRRTHDQFSVVPEVQVGLRYDVAAWLRTSVGYNFLYWNNVVRPGDQLNRVINAGTIDNSGRDVLNVGFANRVQPGTPAPLFRTSDIWAHGLTFSVELRY